MRTTNIRFTGLASGLDTESMVQAMVMPYKNKVDSAVQQQKLLELKQDAWKDMNSKIYSFYTSTLNDLRLEGTFNQKSVTVSKPGIIEINPNGSFPDGTHEIKNVQLASGAVVNTNRVTKPGTEEVYDGSATLADLGITDGTAINIKVNNGTEVNLLEGKDLTKMTLDDLAAEMSKAGVSAQYDSGAGAFFVTSKETGKGQTIQINATGDPDALKKLGLSADGSPINVSGKPASLEYNGVKVESETNVINVNGMSIKILGELKPEAGSINVVSQTDTESLVETMVSFVDKYNKLIDEINLKVNAPYNKDYLPLTDEQKKDMSEEDIKLWNAKVESSILRKDPVLQDIVSSMRKIITTTSIDVDGKRYDLSSFGISTSSDYTDGGKLYIDEEKLRESLSKNPEVFKELFTQQADPTDKTSGGIGTKLYADMGERLKGSVSKSSNFLFNDKVLEDRIKDQEDKVDDLQDRMYRMENLYYAQFTAMEQALSSLNNQSSWLASQLGGM